MSYCPKRGDIGWLDMCPQAGREQAGRRPVICLSPFEYNKKTGLALFCPITSQIKGYPFEVELPAKLKTSGVVLSDQVRSLDWRKRNFSRIEFSSDKFADDVSEFTKLLLGDS